MNFRLWAKFYEPMHPQLEEFKQMLVSSNKLPASFDSKDAFIKHVRRHHPERVYLAHTVWDRFTDHKRRLKANRMHAVHADHE